MANEEKMRIERLIKSGERRECIAGAGIFLFGMVGIWILGLLKAPEWTYVIAIVAAFISAGFCCFWVGRCVQLKKELADLRVVERDSEVLEMYRLEDGSLCIKFLDSYTTTLSNFPLDFHPRPGTYAAIIRNGLGDIVSLQIYFRG